MQVYSSVLEMIGRTPLLRVNRFDTGKCELYLKLELMNPAGSIKDRIGVSMIEEAERRGDIKPGDTLVEATAGNTGLGVALVAQQKGYRLVLVLPDKMSQEKIFNLRAMGAEVILTRSDVAKGHPEYYQDLGERRPADVAGERAERIAAPGLGGTDRDDAAAAGADREGLLVRRAGREHRERVPMQGRTDRQLQQRGQQPAAGGIRGVQRRMAASR